MSRPCIICRQLFAGHVVGSRPMKRNKNLLRMRIKFICYFAFICEFGVLASYFSKDLFKRYPKPWCEKQSPISFLSQKGSDHYYSIWIDKLMILILFHFIAMQIRAELGLLPNWVKQKTGAKNSRERLCNKANTKEGTAWIKLKKIKTDCNSGFGKLVSLTVFLKFPFVLSNIWYNA